MKMLSTSLLLSLSTLIHLTNGSFILNKKPIRSTYAPAMTWEDTWNDILGGGSPRWKIENISVKENALAQITKQLPEKESLKILCPLAGDDRFVHTAWKNGHAVTAIDLVPAAVGAMRQQFGPESEWTQNDQESGMVQWAHSSKRATLYQGDVLTVLPELQSSFDAVYDKDAFGALPKDMRSDYCKRVAGYTKPGGILYVEVKLKDDDHPQREAGPPYSVDKETLMQSTNFGYHFEYVAGLGEVFPLSLPYISQTAHILRRLRR
jgi:thiopurine S-methyltransferase